MPQGDKPADPLLGTLIDNRFRVLSVIGSGGNGTVYLAEQESLDRLVAIKVLKIQGLSSDLSTIKRFQQEASVLKTLEHENIVQIYAFGTLPGSNFPFIVLENLAGGALSALIAERHHLPLDACWSIFEQLGAGLAHAHSRGIVHRDIKPANLIFVTAVDPQLLASGQLKIVDFGLSKLTESASMQKLTKTGALMGTPLYMSPEQVCGKQTTAATDVYSAACVMYECLYGRTPFTGDSFLELVMKQTESQIEIPPTLPDGTAVPKGLESLLHKALHSVAEKRLQDGSALLEWIKAVKAQPDVIPDVLRQTGPKTKRLPSFVRQGSNPIKLKWVLAVLGLGLLVTAMIVPSIHRQMEFDKAQQTLARKIISAVTYCRNGDFHNVRQVLESAQKLTNKYPQLQYQLERGVLEARQAMAIRHNDRNHDSFWLLARVSKVPFEASDVGALQTQYLACNDLIVGSVTMYKMKNKGPEYLEFAYEGGPYLVDIFHRLNYKTIPELDWGVAGMDDAAECYRKLYVQSKDLAEKRLLLAKEERLLECALAILSPTENRAGKLTKVAFNGPPPTTLFKLPQCYLRLAIAKKQMGKVSESVPLFEKAIQQFNPAAQDAVFPARARTCLADALRMEGKFDLAMQNLELAKRSLPKNGHAHLKEVQRILEQQIAKRDTSPGQ